MFGDIHIGGALADGIMIQILCYVSMIFCFAKLNKCAMIDSLYPIHLTHCSDVTRKRIGYSNTVKVSELGKLSQISELT